VGQMAGIVRVALENGHPPWTPLDVLALPSLQPPAIEPVRLEARIKEFYRTLDRESLRRAVGARAALLPPPPAAARRDESDDEGPSSKRRRGDTGAGYSTRRYESDDPSPRAGLDVPLGDDNVGKSMLKSMGWQEGRGLGASGTGIAEPISLAPQTDNLGVGGGAASAAAAATAAPGANDAFTNYRNSKSSNYKSRWG